MSAKQAEETTKKTTAKKKSTTASRKKPAATKKLVKSRATSTKTATKKAATKKTTTKKATTKKAAPATKKATVKKAATKTKKTAKKTASKTSKKTTSKSAPSKDEKLNSQEVQETAEKVTKPATKKAATKMTLKQKKAAAEAAKIAVAKTQIVGQKPRSEPSAPLVKPTTMAVPQRPTNAVGGQSSKPTPESKAAKQTFKVNDFVVYPAHGVGKIVGIEKQVIAGITNELFLVNFEHEKMKLRVPTAKAQAVGMRSLSTVPTIDKAIELLKGRARVKRTMWSRRAQEYEAKINSGDVIQVAEVVRDLYRSAEQPEQSYSERQLFEAALDRFAREVAAVKSLDLTQALSEVDASLQQKKAA